MTAKETKAQIKTLQSQIKALEKQDEQDQREVTKRSAARLKEMTKLDKQLAKLEG
jgi:hypothetical protein